MLSIPRRHFVGLLAGSALAAMVPRAAAAQDLRFFRIGAGPIGENHFAMASLIANVISNPPGSRECERGGSCGVPGLIATAQSTAGPAANLQAIGAGRLDGALAQADLAAWAIQGGGIFSTTGAVRNLRAVAKVYSDSFHMVVRRRSGITDLAGLKGKRVAIGEEGSGAIMHAPGLFKAAGFKEGQLHIVRMPLGAGADAMVTGDIDAILVIDAAPSRYVEELAHRVEIAILPIEGPVLQEFRAASPFLREGTIDGGLYAGIDQPVRSVEIGVVFLVKAQAADALVYGMSRALWHPSSQSVLRGALPVGRSFNLEATAEKTGAPLHPGAAAFYAEAGVSH